MKSSETFPLLSILGVLLLAIAACQLRFPTDNSIKLMTTPMPSQVMTSWYSLYFTDPGGANSRSLRGGVDKPLADAIRAAHVSVDIAVQQLDLWSIRDALISAYRRGVTVRMVTESDYMDEREVQQLLEAGIPVLGDRREGLMHNKFVIIDRQEVWTGSMNFTISEAYRNNNNLMRIRSAELARDYLIEFEEMFIGDQFGPGSPANTPHPTLRADDTLIEVYFSPDDGVATRLIELIQSARKSIYFLAYSFTLDELAKEIIARAAFGVDIAGVMDASQAGSNLGSDYERFLSAGLDVRLDGNPNNMHHKVFIVDRETVVLGSYNFTLSAETRNDENLLIIHNADIAAQFLQEFQRVFQQAR